MTDEGAPLEGTTAANPLPPPPDPPPPVDPICPYLGMVGDRNGHHSFPSRLHLCHAGEPAHIGLGFQADYCLGGGYPSCARFQRAEEAAAADSAAADLAMGSNQPMSPTQAMAASAATLPMSALGDGPSDTVAAPVSTASAKLGRVRSPDDRRSSPLVSILLALALLSTLAAFAIAAGIIKLPAGGIAVVPTPTATLASSATAPTVTNSPLPTTAAPSPTLAPTPLPSAATGEITHVVQPGETLTSISELYNVPIADITARNGITDPNSIVAGQVLIIPAAGSSLPPSVVPPTASVAPSISANPSVSPIATSLIYVVESGDTLSKIAEKFGVLQQAILDANPEITDPNKIRIGQQIIIPAP